VFVSSFYLCSNFLDTKPAMTDVLTGATALMAEVNGIEKEPHVREKLAELICTSELCYGAGIAAAINGYKSPSGTYVPDIMFCNVSRRHAGLNIYHEYDILADIAGGMPATLPRPGDWVNEETRPFVEKYMARNPKVDVKDVLKAFAWVQGLSCSESAGVSCSMQECTAEAHPGWSRSPSWAPITSRTPRTSPSDSLALKQISHIHSTGLETSPTCRQRNS
jgi:aromatic ring hydroxylase